jgi:hypothetical protein
MTSPLFAAKRIVRSFRPRWSVTKSIGCKLVALARTNSMHVRTASTGSLVSTGIWTAAVVIIDHYCNRQCGRCRLSGFKSQGWYGVVSTRGNQSKSRCSNNPFLPVGSVRRICAPLRKTSPPPCSAREGTHPTGKDLCGFCNTL